MQPGQSSTETAQPARTPRSQRTLWPWVLAVGLAAVLLFFSLRGIDWRRVWNLLIHAHWRYLVVSSFISGFTYFLRSLRWRVLLTGAADFEIGVVFWANTAGYLANNLLPARAGELIRSVVISNRSGLTKAYVLTTALTERLADAIVLVLCGSIILLRVNPKPKWMDDVSRPCAAIAILGVVFLAALPWIKGILEHVLDRIPLPPMLRKRLQNMMEQVVSGVSVFHHYTRLLQFGGLTAVIWCADAIGIMICARALDLHINFPLGLLLLVGIGLGSGLPSTPGYVGIYQFVTVSVLAPFGIDRTSALAFSLLIQAFGYVLLLVLGVLSLYKLRKQPAGIHPSEC